MKNKNPLYVIKGKNVEQASSFLDLIIKKLDLEEAIVVFKNIFSLLLAQVQTYAVFESITKFMNDLLEKIKKLLEASTLWTGRASIN